jgi:hypothetical protein
MQVYGEVTYLPRSKSWKIVCQPHVSLKLKRLFTNINADVVGESRLTATPANSRDLEWFLDRYPMSVNPAGKLTEIADKYREQQTTLENLLSGAYTGTNNFTLKKPARDYQLTAANTWLTVGGLLLGDAVGLGKTVSALTGLTDQRTLPALVVVQSHLPDQWIEKIQEFTHLTTHKVLKGTPYDVTKYTGGIFPDVLVLNYHKLAGWADTIAGMLKSVVYDEVQELRHTGTAKYSAAELLASKVPYRLGLSATPIFNYGGEIWNVMNVLTPDQLGSFPEFRREWSNQNSDDAKLRIKDPKVFGFFLRQEGLMLRRTRKEVRRELPAVTVVPHKVAADLSVLNVIKGDAVRLAQLILHQKQDFKGQKMQAAGEFDLRMRMATGIAKAPHVAEFVKMLCLDNDIKVILFGWHREVYDIWMEALEDLNPVMYTGSETPAQKEAAKWEFIHGKSRLMLMSLRSGAGTDGLQDVCSTVVFGEYDYSPAVHKQCTGRVNRDRSDGTPCDPVVAYYATSDHGSDPTMMRILGIKNEQSEGIVNPDSDLAEDIQVDPENVKRLAREFLTQHGIAIEADQDSNNSAEVV